MLNKEVAFVSQISYPNRNFPYSYTLTTLSRAKSAKSNQATKSDKSSVIKKSRVTAYFSGASRKRLSKFRATSRLY